MAARETIVQTSVPVVEKPKPVITVKKEVDAKTMADMLDEMVWEYRNGACWLDVINFYPII